MRVLRHAIVLVLILALSISTVAQARDAARDLRRMVGFTVIDAMTVREAVDAKLGGKLLILDNGDVYRVDLLLLSPLRFTDVIVFAKRYSKDELAAIRAKVPSFPDTRIKLLIDNEAYDATLLDRR